VADVLATQTRTIGGSSDTDVNDDAAIPTGSPPTRAHTAVTPLGKHENALRRTSPFKISALARIIG
jgi:hypothetical protein